MLNPQDHKLLLNILLFLFGGVPSHLLTGQTASREMIPEKILLKSNAAYFKNIMLNAICQGAIYGQ